MIIAIIAKSDEGISKMSSETRQDLFSYVRMRRLSVMAMKHFVIPAYFMWEAVECHSETTSQQVSSE